MRILAVTPWDGHGTPSGKACGIAGYAEMLHAHLPHPYELVPEPEALNPEWLAYTTMVDFPAVVWLNHHRGLHSRWTPLHVTWLQAKGVKVVITFHDTYGEREPDALATALHAVADAFIVHEPCVGLPKAIEIRQGVLAWQGRYMHDQSLRGPFGGERPLLGTCGFNFPWKNFDRLAAVTAAAGWGFVVLSNNASTLDTSRWLSLNPHTMVTHGYLSAGEIISRLAGCDATAFPYECANSGTSGAIRLGIAARKPVLAFEGCRQFRDLRLAEDTIPAIWWPNGWGGFEMMLHHASIQRVDPGIVAIAERDSWVRHGQRYAEVFRGVCA